MQESCTNREYDKSLSLRQYNTRSENLCMYILDIYSCNPAKVLLLEHCAIGAKGILHLQRVVVYITASQLDRPSLTLLFVAGWSWLLLGVAYSATSVAKFKIDQQTVVVESPLKAPSHIDFFTLTYLHGELQFPFRFFYYNLHVPNNSDWMRSIVYCHFHLP